MLLFRPDYFPYGSDVEAVKRLPGGQFYKKFRKTAYDKFCKTLFVLEKMKSESFVPKVLKIHAEEQVLHLTDCGPLLRIATLPYDWEIQLVQIRKRQSAHGLLLKDWGLWELNPFVLNNLCLSSGRIYFIDIGDTVPATPAEIEAYFNRKIRAVKLVLTFSYLYLPFHYLRRIYIMIYRKCMRPGNFPLILLLVYFITTYFQLLNDDGMPTVGDQCV
jgi:hypothetical protein